MTGTTKDVRHHCRNTHCRSKLLAPAEPRRAFCTRTCFTSFFKNRCRVCAEPSPNGRLHAKGCAYAHKQNPDLYAFKKLEKPSDGGLSPKRPRDSRNPYFMGLKTRGRTWGPVVSDEAYWLATLPIDSVTAARLNRANNAEQIRRETAWGRRHASAVEIMSTEMVPAAPQTIIEGDGLDIPDILKRPLPEVPA
jgi:hypothetical protein